MGEDALRINTIDADGIALRAIQALEARTRTAYEELRNENDELRRENAELRAWLSALRERFDALEQRR